MTGADEKARKDDANAFGALLFALALLPRLLASLCLAGEPVWDGHYYDFGARRIALGMGYSDDLVVQGVSVWHPWCHYPVGYSAFLGFFYWLLGQGPKVVPVVDSATGAALAWVTWRLARHGMAERRARIAGLLVALHPGLVLYAGLEMTEPLAALLTLASFWLAVEARERTRGLVLSALLLGISTLVRPQALLCAPFLALVLKRDWRARLRWAALACVLALVPVVPWTARNCRVMDGCALVSTNAGWNLAIGAFPRATGRFETLRSSDGCREVTGQVQQDRCWLAYGLLQIATAPLHWIDLVPKKLGYTFDHESFAVEYLHEARPSLFPEPLHAHARDATTLAHRILVVFASFGLVGFARRQRGAVVQGGLAALLLLLVYIACSGTSSFWPLVVLMSVVPFLQLRGSPPWPPALVLPIVLLATTVLTHAVFFGEDRYHVVVSPVFCMLAAGAFRRAA